jgi:polyisoprenoid-binding protein YceI
MKSPACALSLVLAFAGLAHARPMTFNLASANGPKQITFESRAPVEYIEGDAEEVGGSIDADFQKPGLGLHASISVPVTSMRTGLDQRDEHLRSTEWLDAEHYPAIRFELDPVVPQKISARGTNVWAGNVQGTFFLKGVTKKILVPVTISREGDEHLVVEGRFPVKLSDYNIHGPITMRMIGMKVSETVQVAFKLVGVKDKGWDNVKASPKPQSAPKAKPRHKIR